MLQGSTRDGIAAIVNNEMLCVSLTSSGVPEVPDVPEPSTWAMLILGFAGLGFAFRRSRRVSFA